MNIGNAAPDFTLKDGDGKEWSLRDNRGKTVVLLFYPGDNTPVCTAQLCSVRDNWSEYQATGAEVVGCWMDDPAFGDYASKADGFVFSGGFSREMLEKAPRCRGRCGLDVRTG